MIRSVELEAFCYESEDPERVRQALLNVASGKVTCTTAVSHLGARITRMRVELTKKKDIAAFMEKIRHLEIDPVPRMAGNTVHIRLSKQDAYAGEIKFGDTDIIKVLVRIQAYPARMAPEEAARIFSPGKD